MLSEPNRQPRPIKPIEEVYPGKIACDIYGICLDCHRKEWIGYGTHGFKWRDAKVRLVARGWRQIGAWGFACPECKGQYDRKRGKSA